MFYVNNAGAGYPAFASAAQAVEASHRLGGEEDGFEPFAQGRLEWTATIKPPVPTWQRRTLIASVEVYWH